MKKILAIILVLCLLPGMTVFGSEDTLTEDPESLIAVNSPAGAYKLTDIASTNGGMIDVVSTIVDLGMNLYLFLDEDGTGMMDILTVKIPLTWDEELITLQNINVDDFKLIDDDSYDDDDDLYDDDDDDDDDDDLYDDDDNDIDDDDDADDLYDDDDLDDDDTLRIPYEYSDGALKVRMQSLSMDYVSLSDEELADYEENGASTLGGIAGIVLQSILQETGLEDIVSGLLFDLMFASMSDSREPIPAGEPSDGFVSGTIDNIEFTIAGLEVIPKPEDYEFDFGDDEEDDDELFVILYYDVTNHDDILRAAWEVELDASQEGEFLDGEFGSTVEEYNANFCMAPGTSARCASAFSFEPDDGVIGFRFSSRNDDETILYYVDPQNMPAPEEPFAFSDDDDVIPEYLADIPDENDAVRFEKTERFTSEEGDDAVRFYWTFVNTTEEEVCFTDIYNWYAIQNSLEMPRIYALETEEENNCWEPVEPGEEILCAAAFRTRSGSPATFVVYEEETDDMNIPVLAWAEEAAE